MDTNIDIHISKNVLIIAVDFERLAGKKKADKGGKEANSILAISLLARQYLISGDVLNPWPGL